MTYLSSKLNNYLTMPIPFNTEWTRNGATKHLHKNFGCFNLPVTSADHLTLTWFMKQEQIDILGVLSKFQQVCRHNSDRVISPKRMSSSVVVSWKQWVSRSLSYLHQDQMTSESFRCERRLWCEKTQHLRFGFGVVVVVMLPWCCCCCCLVTVELRETVMRLN